ncbi:hypothetical protein BJV77DRAFT_632998 [Russula vinacea]|nr:hypothetical protein BJV77DRAFT_632998 [Russula vinacea]
MPHGPMPFLYDNPIQPHSVLGTIPSQNIPWLSPVLNIPRPFVCGSRMVEISAEIAPCIRTLGLWGECDASTVMLPVQAFKPNPLWVTALQLCYTREKSVSGTVSLPPTPFGATPVALTHTIVELIIGEADQPQCIERSRVSYSILARHPIISKLSTVSIRSKPGYRCVFHVQLPFCKHACGGQMPRDPV